MKIEQVNEIWAILENGRAQQNAVLADTRFTEEHRQKLAGPLFQNAVQDARALADTLRKQAADSLSSAESAMVAEMRAYETSADATRLVAKQNEWAALANGGRWNDVQRAIDTAVRLGDETSLRAATTALGTLRERATGDLSPLRHHRGEIETLGDVIAEERAKLEPKSLQAARGRYADAQRTAAELDMRLNSINQRTTKGGGPGLFAEQGVTVVEYKKDGGMRFSRPGGWR